MSDGIPHNRGCDCDSNPPLPRRPPLPDGFVHDIRGRSRIASIFEYFERDGAIWGGYEGDTVTFGKFVGTRTGDTIWVSFVHVLKADGTVVTGDGESELELTDDGGIRLVEHYEMHGLPQLSVCEEIAA